MKKIFLLLFLPLTACLILLVAFKKQQPMIKSGFNHYAISVSDLKKSSEFYEKILKLEKIEEPFKVGRHSWYKIGEHCQLHVVLGTPKKEEHTRDNHLSFSVAPFEEFLKHLEKNNIPYYTWAGGTGKEPTVRPDGVRQVGIQDPDGYWIEINDDKY